MARAATDKCIVLKVGGSHVADRARIIAIERTLAVTNAKVVVVPGGGPFADAVRSAQEQLAFSGRLAHRLALEAMTSYARVLAELFPTFVLAATRAEIDAVHMVHRVPIWHPERLLEGHAGIEESWAVTSDSLAAWLAFELDAAGLIIVKSLDGPEETTAADLTAAGITDDAFPAHVARLSCPVRLVGPGTINEIDNLLTFPAGRRATVVLPPAGLSGAPSS